MKRLAATLSLALALAGAGTTSAQQVTLEFPSWQAAEAGTGDWFRAVIAEFEKQNPNVKVNLFQVPFAQYIDTMTTRFAANRPPDIVHLPSRNFEQFANQGWLEPIGDVLQSAGVTSNWANLQSTMTWEGKPLGMLLSAYGYVLFYNEKLLRDAGITTVPRTMTEMIAAARATTRDGNFGFGATTAEHPNNFLDFSQYVIGNGGSWVTGNQHTLTDPKVVAGVNQARQLYGFSPKGATSNQRRQLFLDGKIAMMIDIPLILAQRAQAPEAVRPFIKVARAPFAVTPGNTSNGLHMAAGISPQKRALVAEFMKLIATPQWQTRYGIMAKTPPPRKGSITAEVLTAVPEMTLFNTALTDAEPTVPAHKTILVNYNEYSTLIGQALLRMTNTTTPTETVLADLQRQLTQKFPLR